RRREEQRHGKPSRLCLLGEGRKKQAQKAEGAERQRLLLLAFEAYEDFGLLTGNRELVSALDDLATLSRPDVWARGRLAALVAGAPPEARKPLEDRIAAKFARLKQGGDLAALRRFGRVFGHPSAGGR